MALVGRLAFVTGAGSGIGRATCQALARDGASVVAADRNLKNAEETVTLLKEFKENHVSLHLDVGDSSSVNNNLDKILSKYKRPPTIIVNCAGITRDNFVLKLSEEDFDEVLKINLKGTFLVVKQFAQAIVEHGINNASIINVASIVGKYGNIGQANYSASKAGVERLTRTASLELGDKGIRVNAVLPGMIATPMLAAVPEKSNNKVFEYDSTGEIRETRR
ncbi:hypothetical protein NQ315_012073 [Exocentrus adspersus]|uniref:(3R)-3-hydroxyacyl-CoA dehydrogenase n=1 Tax=Exocentrus adspersus TaxID=1586481 RepID=A0AAV8VXT9_9CUCU|nr:hypothetical protein NQ315_012073 [Exocentrus adspersus]